MTHNIIIQCHQLYGGFDGESTLDFIKYIGDYQKIYLFEPDKNIIEETKRRLQKEKNITSGNMLQIRL